MSTKEIKAATRTPDLAAILAPNHLQMLREGSAISDAVIIARGYRTVTDRNELEALGFAIKQRRVPALLLPAYGADGSNGSYVLRPDSPRTFDDKRKGKLPDGTYPQKVLKYEVPKGARMHLDVPPTCRPDLGNPAAALWVTEGQKKADALASVGLCALALLGVWNWRGKNALGGLTVLADWEYVTLRGRDVRIAFDSDVMTKASVQEALRRLTAFLRRHGARVAAVYLPPSAGAGKQGVDDYLAAGHTRAELENLAGSPRPAPRAAAPEVELLESEPPTIRRPLCLIDGLAYASTWLHVRETVHESLNRAGEVVRHDPPLRRTERRLFVTRGDGKVFGSGGDGPIDELGAQVLLPEAPPADRLWSRAGLMAYRQGVRPDPADVFGRMAAVFDRFIDFGRSLGDQSTMCAMMACYALASWFIESFTVIGFLWPNGDRGSGKTQLMTLCAELGYLGQVILAGGTYASLRDLADYGALLGFDDAENLSDPRKTDPDKRALLLAGNRRGAFVTAKELAGDKTWKTRYVNAFQPRMFTATRLPDPILASRSIVVPLVRTANRDKANADVLDFSLWPCDRRKLVDDLWALALAHLPEMPAWETSVNRTSALAGRNLEPWRALLAVAAWLDTRGVAGLSRGMEGVAVAYQSQRADFEAGDLTALVVRALCGATMALASRAPLASLGNGEWCARMTSSQVAAEAANIVTAEALPLDPSWISADRVGRRLAALRIPRERGQVRYWVVRQSDLQALVSAYSLYGVCEVPGGSAGAAVASGESVATAAAGDAAAGEAPPVWMAREVIEL